MPKPFKMTEKEPAVDLSLYRCGTRSTGEMERINNDLRSAKEQAYRIWSGNNGGGMPSPR